MKVFLAGTEGVPFHKLTALAQVKNALFSYYHISKKKEESKKVFDAMNEAGQEVICDSGLFTLMFGAGKGGNYDLEYMKDYTRTYIGNAKQFALNKLTIVESDVHKLLGMPAVFELRKQFEDSGMNVLYVWHKEEGIDGLFRMAEKYNYIALSVPELRIILKDSPYRYQDAVHDLLRKIKNNVSKLPRIHLLGNTVQETMETNIAYSCDSTSWLAGGRFGRSMVFNNSKLKAVSIRDELFLQTKKQVSDHHPRIFQFLEEQYDKEKTKDYMMGNFMGAYAYKQYQDWLDKHYKCEAKK